MKLPFGGELGHSFELIRYLSQELRLSKVKEAWDNYFITTYEFSNYEKFQFIHDWIGCGDRVSVVLNEYML